LTRSVTRAPFSHSRSDECLSDVKRPRSPAARRERSGRRATAHAIDISTGISSRSPALGIEQNLLRARSMILDRSAVAKILGLRSRALGAALTFGATAAYCVTPRFPMASRGAPSDARRRPGVSPSGIRAQGSGYGEPRHPRRQNWRHPSDHPSPHIAAVSGRDRADGSSGPRSPACR
jgi:hypothetical protein